MGNPANRKRRLRAMVTFEIAVGLLTLSLIVTAMVWVLGLSVVKINCFTTAAKIARHLAVGDSSQAEAAKRLAPSGSTISISKTASQIVVSCQVTKSGFGIRQITLRSEASMPVEKDG